MVSPPRRRTRRGPRLNHPTYLLVSFVVALYWVFTGFDILYSTGIIGTTKKNDGSGCVCHGAGVPSTGVSVWVEGPASVPTGSTNGYRLKMTGGPAVNGGFNLAAGHGLLHATDVMTQSLFGELTHTGPKPFFNDTVEWMFDYIAPPDTGFDTLFSVGNSVNGDFIPPGDEFNYGEPFIVAVTSDSPTAVGDPARPLTFRLDQNYPNPFNPSTKIGYALTMSGEVELEIYDLSGTSIATLVHTRLGPGTYEADWDASSRPAGIYFYRLRMAGESRVLKMALIR